MARGKAPKNVPWTHDPMGIRHIEVSGYELPRQSPVSRALFSINVRTARAPALRRLIRILRNSDKPLTQAALEKLRQAQRRLRGMYPRKRK